MFVPPVTLRDASRVIAGCCAFRVEWNGDRERGWTVYCACGICTPMSRSFTEAIEKAEAHWFGRKAI